MRKSSLSTIFLIVFIDLMGFGIVLPNLQLYGQRFGIESYFALAMIGATYSIFQFLFAPLLGKWSDRVGRRPVLLVSQLGTLVGFLMLYGAHWFEVSDGPTGVILIFASRIVDGISGGNVSAASAYIADSTTPQMRAKGMGLIGAAFGLGFVFGPVIGGTVAYLAGLQWVPLVACIFSLGALVMTYRYLPESRDPAHATPVEELRRYSFLGIRHALARPVIGPMILMMFVNGFAFAGMEQTYSLLIKLRVFHSPGDWLHRDLLDEASRKSSFASGILFFFIGMIIVTIQGGMIHRLTRRFGEARLVIIGPLLISLGMFIVAIDIPRLLPGAWIWSGFVVGSGLFAVGSSLFNPSLQALISRHAGNHEQGEVLGALQGMGALARALGPVAAGLLFQFILPQTVYQGAAPYYLAGVMCLAVFFWAVALRARIVPPPTTPPTCDAGIKSLEALPVQP